MEYGLVSVIIPVYNRANTIARAINSVLTQTYRDIEIIVIDDCSSDNTRQIILDTYGDNSRVSYHCLDTNSGACIARNKGVEMAQGEFIAFLDSDDAFLPDKIEKQIKLIHEQNADLCATDYIRYRKDGSEELVQTKPGSRKEIYNELLYCNFITTGTLMGHRKCFVDVPFDETLPRYQDWDLVLRLCQKYSFCFIQENTLLQYYQPVSITASTNHAKTYFALQKILKNNEEAYAKNKRAFSQICWLIGIHGSFLKNAVSYSYLWKGVVEYGLNLKRLLILLLIFIGQKDFLSRLFQ